jgi:hypothetical protein
VLAGGGCSVGLSVALWDQFSVMMLFGLSGLLLLPMPMSMPLVCSMPAPCLISPPPPPLLFIA